MEILLAFNCSCTRCASGSNTTETSSLRCMFVVSRANHSFPHVFRFSRRRLESVCVESARKLGISCAAVVRFRGGPKDWVGPQLDPAELAAQLAGCRKRCPGELAWRVRMKERTPVPPQPAKQLASQKPEGRRDISDSILYYIILYFVLVFLIISGQEGHIEA